MSETAGTYHLRWAVRHDLIPVTVIEHQGPFPPTAYDLYFTYQFTTIEQAAAEFVIRTKTYPGIIFVDTERKTVWIPYAEWWMKEEGK